MKPLTNTPLPRALRRTTALARPSLAALCLTPFAIGAAMAQAAEDLPTIMVRPSTPAAVASGQGFGPYTPADTAFISAPEAQNATLWTSDSGALISRIPGGAT
ncbi:MAG: hypothetical protein B7Y61_20880, partial [Rhizobiales bacterium 35-66-30]